MTSFLTDRRFLAWGLPGSALLALAAVPTLDPPALAMAGHWPDSLTAPAEILTRLGKSGWILVSSAVAIAGGAVALRFARSDTMREMGGRLAARASYVFLAVAASGLLANLAKRMIGRPRPLQAGDDLFAAFAPFSGARHESFPSGHSTTFGAFAAALAILAPRAWRPILASGFLLAWTRVILGAHYPSDVLMGFGFGVWFAGLTAAAFDRRFAGWRAN